MKKILQVFNLSSSFGDREILKDVSFEAYENEITVILGPSGAGKTVLLKHLLGLYKIHHGSVWVLEKNLAELQEEEQRKLYLQLGVFYQHGGLLNSMTVGENIALPLEQHTNLSDGLIAQLVYSKLNLVNLLDAYALYPSQLSGGMMKRAALARAIIMDPVLLFCDEPGSGLDPISLDSLDKLILNLRDKLGMTMVIITHEISSIVRIADRIVFMDQGKVIFQGNWQEVDDAEVKQVRAYFETGLAFPKRTGFI